MMGLSDATKWYTQQSGDPSTGFVSGGDAISSVTQIYTDMAAPGSVTDAMLAVPKVNQSVVGNLLPEDQAACNNPAGTNVSGGTAAIDNVNYLSGSESLKITASVDAVTQVVFGDIGVTVAYDGEPITFHAYVRADFAGPVQTYWRATIDGVLATIGGALFYTAQDQWVHIFQTWTGGVAGQVIGNVRLRVNTTTTGQAWSLDKVGVWRGAGGLWALPGVPIANLGTYTDESVGRRIFTWDAVNARWQMTYGDTGWRDVTALTETGFSGSASAFLHIRRMNNTVSWAMSSGTGPYATGNVLIWNGYPVGFRPSQQLVLATRSGAVTLPNETFSVQTSPSPRDVYGLGWAGVNHQITAEFATSDAWPSSLPGTASGSIPS